MALLHFDAEMSQTTDDGLAQASELFELTVFEGGAAGVDLLHQILEMMAGKFFPHRDELRADLVERADLERVQRRDGGIELGHPYGYYSNLKR